MSADPFADAVSAGPFAEWRASLRVALTGGGSMDVPCGSCSGCCTSSQFVRIEADERETLARVPRALRFPAPGGQGAVVLGYDERGHCAMLIGGRCSIYEHRPRACRAYDCRVFAAAGLELGEPEKRAIDERVRAWRFEHPTEDDRKQRDAVRSAAAALDPSLPIVTRALRAVLGDSGAA